MEDLAVCIPTFNEVENIGPLLLELVELYPRSLLVVIDDGSTDGTRESVESLAQTNPNITLLRRAAKDGLGAAYCAGMSLALTQGARVICQMDGDRSHHPRFLKDLYHASERAHFVVGSRYVSGGGCSGWSWNRKLLSQLGNAYARIFVSPSLRDLTGGYNLWHRRVLETIDLQTLTTKGYAFQVELKARALSTGFIGVEVPITFYERAANRSKMTWRIVIEALLSIPRLSLLRHRLTLIPSAK